MRMKIKYLLVALASVFCIQAFSQQTGKVTPAGTGYLQYLPQGYNTNTNSYPVVIALHGIKEKGTSSTDPSLVLAGLNTVANVGLPKYIKYGAQYPFIVISPQLKSSMSKWTGAYVIEVLNYVKKTLRIDNSRIYLTGLSLGGGGVWSVISAYPSTFAAILPICSGYNTLSSACTIASNNVPIWAFHGDADNTVSYTVSQKMVNAVNACTPKPSPLAKLTIFPGMGHIIWDKVYKETTALTWLTSFRKGTTSSSSTTTTNTVPVVSAGGDKSLTLPTNSTYMQGSASDADGSIASWQWTKLSGSTVSMSGTTSSKLTVSNLVAGTYYFRLTVKDNKGASKYDDVKVTVSSSTNKLPVVSAGSDKSTTNSGFTVVGTAYDPDGSIASYQWTKVSGPSVPMSNTTTPKLWVSKLLNGTYYFRLTVKDNKGGTKYDDMKLVVY